MAEEQNVNQIRFTISAADKIVAATADGGFDG
jgi:hypothetical protein